MSATQLSLMAYDAMPTWVDVIVIGLLWAAGLANMYLGVARVNHEAGPYLMARRVVAASMLLWAANWTRIALELGTLPASWPTMAAGAGIAASSLVLFRHRIRIGREAGRIDRRLREAGRRAGDARRERTP